VRAPGALGTAIAFLVAALVIAIVPWFLPSYIAFELAYAGAYAIAILGLVILTGYNGQISLGHGAFMAIGGYTLAIAVSRAGWPPEAALPIAAVLCAIFGGFVGIVALRLSGAYLALATFALAVSVAPVLKRFKDWTGGAQGITFSAAHAPGALAGLLDSERWLYYEVWLIAGLIFAFTWFALRGRLGRALRALRDNEIAAVSFGIDPFVYKSLAFAWSAAYAGIAGVLIASATAYVSPDTYALQLSITLLIGAVLGGLVSLWGAVAGGVVVEFLPLWAQTISPAASSLIYGISLILVMIALPGGIAGAARRLILMIRPHHIRPQPEGQPERS
jgi:branched-chain amino acid transport system permease protein